MIQRAYAAEAGQSLRESYGELVAEPDGVSSATLRPRQMKLSQEHLDRFVEQGYVVVEGALSDADLQPVIDNYAAIVDGIARRLHAKGRIRQLHAGEPFDTRLARICDEDAATYFESDTALDIGRTRTRGLFEIMRNRNLLDLVEGFIGPEIACNAISHVRAKLPSDEAENKGSNIAPWHQDAIFTTPEARELFVLTVWFPLTDATADNGCLQLCPGLHRRGTVYWSLDSQPPCDPVTVPMRKGDMILIHKLCPHGSGPNRTDGIRWSMDLRYQTLGTPSPRPEWPSLVARSRAAPDSLTTYDEWSAAWKAGIEKHPEKAVLPSSRQADSVPRADVSLDAGIALACRVR